MSFRFLRGYILGDWIEIEVGFVGLPSRETRETFGDSVPAISFAFVFFTNILGEVEGTLAGAAPARPL